MQSFVGLAAALVVLTFSTQSHAEVVKLQWGSERTPVKKQASAPTALRFVKPGVTSTKHSDAAIKLAAFNEDAPRLTSARAAEPQTRSVVVNREDEAANGFRAAQLPQANPGAGSANKPGNDSKVEDGLRTPFADNPEQPPQLETPKLDTPPMPENNTTLPPPNNNALQSDQQPPAERQTLQTAPADTVPDTGQFQPILPAGPAPDQSPPTPPSTDAATIEAEGTKAKESCSKSLENLRAYTVDKVNLTISIKGTEGEDYPFECSIDNGTMFSGRCWEQTTYLWKASALCHKPLYFEDEQLERYGHSFSPCFQPFVSGAHFFCTLPVLPYCMGVEPPCECIYALGHYRPGSCAPYMCNPIPLSLRGALIEGGVVTGTAAILP